MVLLNSEWKKILLNLQKNRNITLNNCTWVGSNWTVTKIVVICGNDWYKAKGVDLLTLASYCVLMDIPIPVYVAISWQKNHTTVALSILNKRCKNSHLICSTPTPCITRISLTWISLKYTLVFQIRELPFYWRHFVISKEKDRMTSSFLK